MADISINYLGEEITIREKDWLPFEIKSRFDEGANQAATTYICKYYDPCGNFQTFASRGIRNGYQLLDTYLDDAVKLLKKHGTHNADKQVLKNKYGSTIFRMWATLDYYANGKYDLAQAEVEADRQVREYRKATRSRMVGGGFGIKGAAKGIAMAGTYNFASGLVHSGVNAIGNSMSRNRSQRELQRAYKTEFREFADTAIRLCVQNIGKIVCDELGLDDPYEMEEYVDTLRETFSEVAEEFLPMAVAQIIAIAPWDMDTYKLLLPRFGDPERALYKLIHQAPQSVIIAYNEIRRSLLSSTTQAACEQAKELIAKTQPEDLQCSAFISERDRLRNAIEEKAAWLGCNPRDNVRKRELNVFDEKVAELCQEKDEISRNVAGIVYSSRELAQKAVNNRKKCDNLLSSRKKGDYKEIIRIRKEINEINQSEPKGAVSDYVEQITQKEVEARTVADAVYDTFEIAEKARKNRDMAQNLMGTYTKDPKKKADLLEALCKINNENPQGCVSDYIDSVLVKGFSRKEDEDPKAFGKDTYDSVLERQNIQCEYNVFLCRHPAYDPDPEKLLQNLTQLRSALRESKIDPRSKKKVEEFISTVSEKANSQIRANLIKQQAQKKYTQSKLYAVCVGIFALIAMVFLPLVKISGTPCTFMGIIHALNNDLDLILGGVVLILTYIAFFVAIIRYMLEPLQMLAMVIGFVVVVGGVCLIGGSAYNTSIWLYILLGGAVGGYVLRN